LKIHLGVFACGGYYNFDYPEWKHVSYGSRAFPKSIISVMKVTDIAMAKLEGL